MEVNLVVWAYFFIALVALFTHHSVLTTTVTTNTIVSVPIHVIVAVHCSHSIIATIVADILIVVLIVFLCHLPSHWRANRKSRMAYCR